MDITLAHKRSTGVPEKVVRYFVRKTCTPLEQAYAVYDELVAYLGSGEAPQPVPSATVDEAWHAFLLHSQEYEAFCHSTFGRFVHHVPREHDPVSISEDSCDSCSPSCSRSNK